MLDRVRQMIQAFDFETYLIRPGLQLPPGVCMSFAEVVPPRGGEGATVGAAGVVTAAQGVDMLFAHLRAGDRLVGANTAFDALVSVVTSGPVQRELLRLWVEAYEAGLVHDVLLRQKMLDLAAGCYRYEVEANGRRRAHRYNLAELAFRHRRRRLSKPEDEDETDHWRLRFGELAGMPIEQYPAEAYGYALEDAIATAEVFVDQETARFNDARIRLNFPGRDPFVDEARQGRAAVALKAMSAYGLRTDAAAVERFATEVQEKIDEVRDELVAAGLVRLPTYSRDTAAIGAYIVARGLAPCFVDAVDTSGATAIKLNKANLLAAYNVSGDANFWSLANYRDLDPSGYGAPNLQALVAAGLVEVKQSRDTKAAAARCVAAYAALGRPAPRTDTYVAETSGPLEHVCLDSDACASSEDPLLESYAEYTSLGKTLSNDIPMLRGGAIMPIHPRIEELLQTGRISASKPNTTNVRRLPGIRECFAPRAGCVYIDGDFAMLELHTLAQTCYWVLGYSYLGDALKVGKDPHLQMAATICGLSYDEAAERRAAGDGVVDNARTAGKGVNFGRPGGLGKRTFKVFAWKSYRIRLDDDGVVRLLKQYDDTWLEMPDYFRFISSLEVPGTGAHNVVQPYSFRLRAGATYCAACNSPFQGLGSDVAKLALWLVWKATVGLSELGDADPLFGCHVVNFVHDSIMTEVPEARAHEAAVRQRELMDLAGRMVLPDVPVRADVLVTRQWSKKAARWTEHGTWTDAGTWKADKVNPGRLVPWDMRIACRRVLEAFVRMPDEKRWSTIAKGRCGEAWKDMPELVRAAMVRQVSAEPAEALAFEYLKKKEWPSDIAREAVAGVYGEERIAA
jgi:hypothetical protein